MSRRVGLGAVATRRSSRWTILLPSCCTCQVEQRCIYYKGNHWAGCRFATQRMDGRIYARQRCLLHNERRKRKNWRRPGRQQNPTGRHVGLTPQPAAAYWRGLEGAAVMAEPPPPCGIMPVAISG